MLRHVLLAASLFLVVANAPHAMAARAEPGEASYDCESADHAIEKLVCADKMLTALDRKLAHVFDTALDKVEAMPNTAPQIRHMKAYELRWSRQRNECEAASDPKACTTESYRRRIAELQARYLLAATQPPLVYDCDNGQKSKIIATFVKSEPPSVRLERNGKVSVAVEGISGSGARYLGAKGLVFWIKGDEAMVTWPKGSQFSCSARN